MDVREIMEPRTKFNVDIAAVRLRQNELKVFLGLITSELRRRDSPGPTVDVSEHAVVRYLERVLGVDVSAIRQTIREAIPAEAKRGDNFTVDGVTYVIAPNGRVTTAYLEPADADPAEPS